MKQAMRSWSVAAATLLIFPVMALGPQSEVSVFKIPSVQRQLAKEEQSLQQALRRFPDLQSSRQQDQFGYHGGYLPVRSGLPDEPRWQVELQFYNLPGLQEIILIPAIDPRFTGHRPYGFPRRMRVICQDASGRSTVAGEWMTSDVPHRGAVPFRIPLPPDAGSRIRIEIFQGAVEEDREFCALGEIFCVSREGIWLPVAFQVSPSYESPPYWSRSYLTDQRTGLGMPRGPADPQEVRAALPDMEMQVRGEPGEAPALAIDLGEVRELGWLNLFPAIPPAGDAMPGYGFPSSVQLRVSSAENPWEAQENLEVAWDGGNPGNNVVRLPLSSRLARWLIMEMDGLPQEQGIPVFALGELTVQFKKAFLPVREIRSRGLSVAGEKEVNRLVDGLAGGWPVMTLRSWLQSLEEQQDLRDRLEEVQEMQAVLHARWDRFRTRGTGAAAGGLFLLLGVFMLRRQVRLVQLRLQVEQEHQLAEVEKMKLRVFTQIAHELRTPLTVIPLPIERALKQVEDARLRTSLEVALKNVHELQDLVEQILGLRRVQAGKMTVSPQSLNVSAMLRELVDAMQPLADRNGVTLLNRGPEEEVWMTTGPMALKRIAGNLIGNAIKYTPAGGEVWVEERAEAAGLVWTVEDTGPGIPPDDLAHIFEEHFRASTATAVPGSGIGMTLVRELVDLLGGRIEVRSPVSHGRGTRITVFLPEMEAAEEERPI